MVYKNCLLFMFLLLFVSLLYSQTSDNTTLYAGVSVNTIPFDESKNYILGGYEERESNSIHDNLTTRAVVFKKDDVSIMLISVDLLLMGQKRVFRIRREISKETGIPESHIIIHCIHTHSAPVSYGIINYFGTIKDVVVQSAVSAYDDMKEIKIFHNRSEADLQVNNRRESENIISLIDTLVLKDAFGMITGIIVNTGCHPVIMGPSNKSISADYINFLRKYLEEKYSAPVLFFNADQGDKNPPPITYSRHGSFSNAAEFGEAMALHIERSINNAVYMEVPSLKAKSIDTWINIKGSGYAFEWLLDKPVIKYFHPDHTVRGTKKLTTLSLFYIGSTPIITSPGESTRRHRQNLSRALGLTNEMYIDLANDYIAYIITPEEWLSYGDEERRRKTVGEGISNLIISVYNELYRE